MSAPGRVTLGSCESPSQIEITAKEPGYGVLSAEFAPVGAGHCVVAKWRVWPVSPPPDRHFAVTHDLERCHTLTTPAREERKACFPSITRDGV